MKRLLTLSLIMLPAMGFAHPGHESVSVTSGMFAGLLHPLMGLDHLLAMLALGVLLYKTDTKQTLLIGSSCAVLLAVGFFGAQTGVLNIEAGLMETMILLSVVLAVGLIVLKGLLSTRIIKINLGAILVAGFALFHGVAHGVEVPAGASSYGFALGFMVSCVTLIALARFTMTRVSGFKLNVKTQE